MEKNGNLSNVTFNYYTGFNITKYSEGSFFTKIFDINGIHYAGYNGHINMVDLLELSRTTHQRKRILLSNNQTNKTNKTNQINQTNKTISFPLEKLDNYYSNSLLLENNSIIDLEQILRFFDIDCTHITIIEIIPFSRTEKTVKGLCINDLYK